MYEWDADKSLRDVPDEFRWRIAGAAQAQDVLERSEEHAAKHGVDAEVRTIEGPARCPHFDGRAGRFRPHRGWKRRHDRGATLQARQRAAASAIMRRRMY
jgi:hypothetical protein